MPRKRTGTLIPTGRGYSVRFANGPLIPLHTDDLRVARAKQRALANDPTRGAPTPGGETFEEAAKRLVQVQLDLGVPSAPARASRLRRWAFPILGAMKVAEIRPGHVASVLEHVASLGKSTTTLTHMRGDMIYVFSRLLKEETLTRNPARGELVDTPPGVDDPRPRVLLRDEEFTRFVDAPTTRERPQLRMMSIVSRAFGGMRTSDLRAWDWTHIDVPRGRSSGWEWADVPRPKTTKRGKRRAPGEAPYQLERLTLPDAVAAELRAWWVAAGRPVSGPVFQFPPARKSFAADLRAALLAAGVDRHELHHNTAKTKRVDFHSFRRAWSTAIGAAGLNAQTAMKVTGHRQLSTHMRYVRPEAITIPSAAVPTWGAAPPITRAAGVTTSPLSILDSAPEPTEWDKALESFKCEEEDSNLHGSYPASTSSESDLTTTGTNVHRSGSQPHEPTTLIEPTRDVSGVFRNVVRSEVVASNLSIVRSAAARRADAALQAYLRTIADEIAGDLKLEAERPTWG